MPKTTTRAKIVHRRDKLFATYDTQCQLLREMWDLAEDKSGILNQVTAPILYAIEEQKKLVEHLLEGL